MSSKTSDPYPLRRRPILSRKTSHFLVAMLISVDHNRCPPQEVSQEQGHQDEDPMQAIPVHPDPEGLG